MAGPHLLDIAVIEALAHVWDLVTAIGHDVTSDAEAVHVALGGVRTLGAQLAATGMYATARHCPPDASEQDQLISATGRNPAREEH